MKHFLLQKIVFFFIAISLVGCIEEEDISYEQTSFVQIGDVAPDFTVETINGQIITLSEHRDKIVLITFFSTTCNDCLAQFEYIKDKIVSFDAAKFLFLPIVRGEGYNTVERFQIDNNFTFDMGYDSKGSIYALYATRYVPRNYLIDHSGKIILLSAEPSTEQLDALLNQISELIQ